MKGKWDADQSLGRSGSWAVGRVTPWGLGTPELGSEGGGEMRKHCYCEKKQCLRLADSIGWLLY